MKNPRIASTLKYYKKLNELSVNEVADIFKEHHNEVAPKTIYGWESGNTQPDADTLMFLCELYHIENILEAFGYKEISPNSSFHINDFERKLVENYRENVEIQPAIKRLLQLED